MKKIMALALVLMMTLGSFTMATAETPLELTGMFVQYQQAPAEDSDFWKWMESTFHVDYSCEWVPESSYNDKLSLVLSTGDLPDIVQVTSTTDASVVNAANDGLFYDLTDLLDPEKFPNLANLNPSAWTNSKINGRNYFIPRTRGQYNTCLYLRKDILNEMGVGTPVKISEFETYFRYIKEKHPDMVPLAYQYSYVSDFFIGAFGDGAIIPVFTEDGTGLMHEVLTESYAKCVEWFQKLYADNLYASEFALYTTDKNNDLFLAGKTGARHQNLWHRWRLENAMREAVPTAELDCAFYVTSDDGKNIAVQYDVGFYGGQTINSEVPEEKVLKILEFLNATAAPESYNTFRYGLEGIHWNMENGFPVSTEQGKAEVTSSFYGPFCLATNLYDKVDSPLATTEYNLQSREMAKVIDEQAAKFKGSPFRLFSILKSNTWSNFWAVQKSEFDNFVAETIAGRHTIDELRAYQAKLIEMDEVKIACKEFKESYDGFGLANWTPPEAK